MCGVNLKTGGVDDCDEGTDQHVQHLLCRPGREVLQDRAVRLCLHGLHLRGDKLEQRPEVETFLLTDRVGTEPELLHAGTGEQRQQGDVVRGDIEAFMLPPCQVEEIYEGDLQNLFQTTI